MSDDNPEYTPDVVWIDPQSCYYELEPIESEYVSYMRVSIHDGRMAAALARAEAAEAEAVALRARVAELEAELAAFTAGEHVATLTLVDGTIHRFYMRPFDEDALRARVAELERQLLDAQIAIDDALDPHTHDW